MPHVEVLPNSTASVAPGWTYVVDTGYDPSKVAINPKNKKRAAAQPGGQRGENELSARQQTAIARRIAELERDNDPKQSIAIPGKPSMCTTIDLAQVLTSMHSRAQDAKHATNNTIPTPDQTLARRRRSPARSSTTDAGTARGSDSFTKQCAISPALEYICVNPTYTDRSNTRSFNTACAVSNTSRFRGQRRCTPLHRKFDASRA
jgi:hypothetical protein